MISRSFGHFSQRLAGVLPLMALCGGLNGCHPGNAATESNRKTIGLVLSGFDYQLYSTKDGKEECPEGFVYSSKENWYAQFPTRAARQAQFDRCGAIDRRGPNCESVLAAPELVQDPLPYREVKGAKSYGLNLDGTDDGRQTASTCTHKKFVSPDGVPGVDNQFYRLLGCQRIVRSELVAAQSIRDVIVINRAWRTLLEIRGVVDPRNDPQVEVYVYQGAGPLVVDSNNKAVAWQSQQIDENIPPQRLRGRIVEGELITEPADVSWGAVGIIGDIGQPLLLRGSQIRLRLTESGAQGIRTGYVDADQWWLARKTGGIIGSFTGDSPPALNAALHRLADGYKDPKTGACTALSSAMRLEFVRAFVRH